MIPRFGLPEVENRLQDSKTKIDNPCISCNRNKCSKREKNNKSRTELFAYGEITARTIYETRGNSSRKATLVAKSLN